MCSDKKKPLGMFFPTLGFIPNLISWALRRVVLENGLYFEILPLIRADYFNGLQLEISGISGRWIHFDVTLCNYLKTGGKPLKLGTEKKSLESNVTLETSMFFILQLIFTFFVIFARVLLHIRSIFSIFRLSRSPTPIKMRYNPIFCNQRFSDIIFR